MFEEKHYMLPFDWTKVPPVDLSGSSAKSFKPTGILGTSQLSKIQGNLDKQNLNF